MTEKLKELMERYYAAGHAVQSGIAALGGVGVDLGFTPKHLRVGVNMALLDSASIGRLLIKKGLITEEEYYTSLVETVEEEVRKYEKQLSDFYGKEITLG